MPIRDDASIPDHTALCRVLIKRQWVSNKGGRPRPTSDSFNDCTGETSCFVSGPNTIAELRRLFPDAFAFATFPARILRENGFGIERRPEDCHPDYHGNSQDHVVFGPTEALSRKDCERRVSAIVKHLDVVIDGLL
jgi:hypothetical protein